MNFDNTYFDNEWIKELEKYCKEHPIEEKKPKEKFKPFNLRDK